MNTIDEMGLTQLTSIRGATRTLVHAVQTSVYAVTVCLQQYEKPAVKLACHSKYMYMTICTYMHSSGKQRLLPALT